MTVSVPTDLFIIMCAGRQARLWEGVAQVGERERAQRGRVKIGYVSRKVLQTTNGDDQLFGWGLRDGRKRWGSLTRKRNRNNGRPQQGRGGKEGNKVNGEDGNGGKAR